MVCFTDTQHILAWGTLVLAACSYVGTLRGAGFRWFQFTYAGAAGLFTTVVLSTQFPNAYPIDSVKTTGLGAVVFVVYVAMAQAGLPLTALGATYLLAWPTLQYHGEAVTQWVRRSWGPVPDWFGMALFAVAVALALLILWRTGTLSCISSTLASIVSSMILCVLATRMMIIEFAKGSPDLCCFSSSTDPPGTCPYDLGFVDDGLTAVGGCALLALSITSWKRKWCCCRKPKKKKYKELKRVVDSADSSEEEQ